MKFFEFHFNPEAEKRDAIFDSFCFVPETKTEENLGSLYLVGGIKNVLPRTEGILAELAEIIKKEYYKPSQRETSDSFKESLARANEFLTEEIKKENVSWLGNLNFAAISLTPDFSMSLAKVGKLKILLVRDNEVFNIGENINFNTAVNKTFPNIVEGKLIQGDKILVLTQKVFEIFENEEIIKNLAEIKKLKEIKKNFKEKKRILKEIFGVYLLIIPEKKGVLFKKIYFPRIPFPLRSLTPFWRKNLIRLLILTILVLLGWLIFK